MDTGFNNDTRTFIRRASLEDAELLADLAKTSFIESHGHSADPHEIDKYTSEAYDANSLWKELKDPGNLYYIIFFDNQPAGFSKIVLDVPHQQIPQQNITKLERIYLLKRFYDRQLGRSLFEFNVNLSKNNDQAGMWLFVWEENDRAISFYKKAGFTIIGRGGFRLTETHSNPNFIMFLEY